MRELDERKMLTSVPLQCAMCMSASPPIPDDDVVVKLKTCPHVFHHRCLLTWLNTQVNSPNSRGNGTCPTCRRRLVEIIQLPLRAFLSSSQTSPISSLTALPPLLVSWRISEPDSVRTISLQMRHKTCGIKKPKSLRLWSTWTGRDSSVPQPRSALGLRTRT